MKKAPAPARVRRNAEASRTAILDATERQLVAHGPASVRLQEVAAEVGVAHPTILHHFGSRERLVAEVVQRRIAAMNGDVLEAVKGGVLDHTVVAPLIERLFAAFAAGGHARVVAFLALTGEPNPTLEGINPVTRALHAMRLANTKAGAPRPSQADSEFIVMLTTLALFGEAIAGPLFRGESPDAHDPGARARFLERLIALVESLFISPTTAPPCPAPPPTKRRRGA